MKKILADISVCTLCDSVLSHGARPVLSAHQGSKILIIGQAPGLAVHNSGIPWDDKSGDNLRSWMKISKTTFYNVETISIMPMGFCYPGKGKSGDLPPRKECAPLWHNKLLQEMHELKLVLLVGKYAQSYYLQNKAKKNLTATVRQFKEYLPDYFVLPHPSPRNNVWQAKNPWFLSEVVPALQIQIERILG